MTLRVIQRSALGARLPPMSKGVGSPSRAEGVRPLHQWDWRWGCCPNGSGWWNIKPKRSILKSYYLMEYALLGFELA